MTNPSKTNPPAKKVQGLPDGTLRTTMTHLMEGDRVLVQTQTADPQSWWVPAPAKPTKRALWATVVGHQSVGMVVTLETGERIVLDYTGHTAITIKDREAGRSGIDALRELLTLDGGQGDMAEWRAGQAAAGVTLCDYCPTNDGTHSVRMSDGRIRHLCDSVMCRELADDDGAIEYGVLHDPALAGPTVTVTGTHVHREVRGGRAWCPVTVLDGDDLTDDAEQVTCPVCVLADTVPAEVVADAVYSYEARSYVVYRYNAATGVSVAVPVADLAAHLAGESVVETPRTAEGAVDWQAVGKIVRSRDTVPAVTVRAPKSEPQRRAIRLLGKLEKSGAQPQINGNTLKALVRDGWVTVDTRKARSVIVLTADALAWLASERTAEVPALAVGEVLAAQEAALGEPQQSTCVRCERTLVWVHEMWIGVNGEVKCPNGLDSHKAMAGMPETSSDAARVTAERPLSETLPEGADPASEKCECESVICVIRDAHGYAACQQVPTHRRWIDLCAACYAATGPEGTATDEERMACLAWERAERLRMAVRDVACEECGIMPHAEECLTGLRLDSPQVAALPIPSGAEVAGWKTLTDRLLHEPRTLHDDELAREHAFWETVKVAASLTADEVAGLQPVESVVEAHNAARPWSAKGGKRKGSSVAVKRQQQQRAGVR